MEQNELAGWDAMFQHLISDIGMTPAEAWDRVNNKQEAQTERRMKDRHREEDRYFEWYLDNQQLLFHAEVEHGRQAVTLLEIAEQHSQHSSNLKAQEEKQRSQQQHELVLLEEKEARLREARRRGGFKWLLQCFSGLLSYPSLCLWAIFDVAPALCGVMIGMRLISDANRAKEEDVAWWQWPFRLLGRACRIIVRFGLGAVQSLLDGLYPELRPVLRLTLVLLSCLIAFFLPSLGPSAGLPQRMRS